MTFILILGVISFLFQFIDDVMRQRFSQDLVRHAAGGTMCFFGAWLCFPA